VKSWARLRSNDLDPSGAKGAKPVVAIIVTLPGRDAPIEKCLAGIISQRFDAWECVVVSSDGGIEVDRARSIERLDPRITALTDRYPTLQASQSAGMAYTTAPYLSFVSGSRVLTPNTLDSHMRALATSLAASGVAGVKTRMPSDIDGGATTIRRAALVDDGHGIAHLEHPAGTALWEALEAKGYRFDEVRPDPLDVELLDPLVEPESESEPEIDLNRELGVLLYPMARYHAEEMSEVAHALRNNHGVGSTFVLAKEFEGAFDEAMVDHDVIRLSAIKGASNLPPFTAALVMNDWGTSRSVVLECRRRNVPSFARVEGVQDFRDVDTGRIRLPYLAADYVLAQGGNDVENLARHNVHIVGNERLEAIFRGPERTAESKTGRVVINSNFTYGVLTEERAEFLDRSVKAILQEGFEPVISQHPADEELGEDLAPYRAEESMSELLHTCDVLVSRFSTVPFEAMALGTPFVYFNPHGEAVDAFLEQTPAYRVVEATDELADAITEAASWLGDYRARSEDFFRLQIDVGEDSAVDRTANQIVQAL